MPGDESAADGYNGATVNDQCTRAEILAGAIALDEASAAERDEYRLHISGCARCLSSLGGEREIERVMSNVRDARAVETWDPVPVRFRESRHSRGWQIAGLAAALAVVLAIGMQSAIGTPIRTSSHIADVVQQPAEIFHVGLISRAAPTAKPVAVVASRHEGARTRMLVLHNVISRRGNRVTQTTVSTTEVAEAPVPHITAPPASNVPIWRRDEAMPRTAVASAPTTAPVLSGRAESLAVAPVIRDVEPVGGDSAISPRPGPIAYEEDAYGTTAFEVTVDERGVAVKCDITKSSGFGSLDQSVCRAAMKARYAPRLVNGRPSVGVYRDAFTFRQLGGDSDTPNE
jgi:TonB family protein